MRLGILTSHPIQYQAPWFRGLAREVELEVFFAHRPDAVQQGEGFGKSFRWDVDLLSGYKHHFLRNVSSQPSPSRFFGCDTPEIARIISGSLKSEVGDQKSEVSGQSAVVNGQRPRRFAAFIVCGWHLKSYWQAIRACRRAGIPVLVRGDSQLMTPRPRLKTWLKKIGYRLMLRQFDGFLVVGQRNREYLAHYGVPAEKMFFAPHFVDNDFFRQKAETLKSQKTEIRKRWGIPEEAFCVLFCGKFISKKRPMDLVAAAQIITAENAKDAKGSSQRPVHLLFVGSGELGAELRKGCNVVFDAEADQRAESRGQRAEGGWVKTEAEMLKGANRSQEPEVRSQQQEISQPLTSDLRPPTSCAKPTASFAGFLNQSELPAAYVAADVVVMPSDGGETWGLVVNEAMACGLPAIVSDAVGCAPDLIEEGKTGFSFPVGNTAALADRLERLGSMQDSNFDFSTALSQKISYYSVQAAVEGTLQSVRVIAAR